MMKYFIFFLLQDCSRERNAFNIRLFIGYRSKTERKRHNECETRFDKNLGIIQSAIFFFIRYSFFIIIFLLYKFTYNI